MLDIIYKHLKKKGFEVTAITGSIPVKERGPIVDNFNNDPNGHQVKQQNYSFFNLFINLFFLDSFTLTLCWRSWIKFSWGQSFILA